LTDPRGTSEPQADAAAGRAGEWYCPACIAEVPLLAEEVAAVEAGPGAFMRDEFYRAAVLLGAQPARAHFRAPEHAECGGGCGVLRHAQTSSGLQLCDLPVARLVA